MFFISIISGLLTTMNVWADKIDDIRFSLNDVYMTTMMSGWMVLLMGIYYKELYPTLIGLIIVIVFFWCIRAQFLVDTKQYIVGMIPHHSMAVHMSKQLLKKGSSPIDKFVKNIIITQEKEIEYMKQII
jgi:hypothetical protein